MTVVEGRRWDTRIEGVEDVASVECFNLPVDGGLRRRVCGRHLLFQPVHSRDGDARGLDLKHRVIIWVYRDWQRFTVRAQVEVGAVRMHALVAYATDRLVATIAGRHMVRERADTLAILREGRMLETEV